MKKFTKFDMAFTVFVSLFYYLFVFIFNTSLGVWTGVYIYIFSLDKERMSLGGKKRKRNIASGERRKKRNK